MEALILTVNVACMVYLCWRVFKSTDEKADRPDLGWFAFEAPPEDLKDRK